MTRMELLVPRICLPLIACFPSLAIAGEGTDWYTSAYEEDFMQALTLIVLVVLALAFDHVWHLVVHSQMHSYKYGQLMAAASVHPTQQHHHAKHKHRVLKFELVSRAGTEFMTLGFLAFSIFTFNILGGFEALADLSGSGESSSHRRLASAHSPLGNATGNGTHTASETTGLHFPQTASDWLHLAEVVHIRMFCGMLLYFGLMAAIVSGSVDRIRDWEDLRVRHVEKQAPGPAETKLYTYKVWRNYFMHAILAYQQNRPALYQEILAALNLSSSEEHQLRARLDARFSLGAYLALSVEAGVADSINVNDKSWVALIVLFGIFALLHGLLEVTLVQLIPFSIALVVLMLAGMWYIVRKRTREINSNTLDYSDFLANHDESPVAQEERSSGVTHALSRGLSTVMTASVHVHETSNTELAVMRVFQVVLYVISVTFTSIVINKSSWKHDWVMTLLQSLGLLLIYALLGHLLPHYVPLFLAQMALPPYVDEDNQEVLLQILSEHADHQQVSSSEVQSVTPTLGAEAGPPPTLVGRRLQSDVGTRLLDANFSDVLSELLQAEEELAEKVAQKAVLLKRLAMASTKQPEEGRSIPGMLEHSEEV